MWQDLRKSRADSALLSVGVAELANERKRVAEAEQALCDQQLSTTDATFERGTTNNDGCVAAATAVDFASASHQAFELCERKGSVRAQPLEQEQDASAEDLRATAVSAAAANSSVRNTVRSWPPSPQNSHSAAKLATPPSTSTPAPRCIAGVPAAEESPLLLPPVGRRTVEESGPPLAALAVEQSPLSSSSVPDRAQAPVSATTTSPAAAAPSAPPFRLAQTAAALASFVPTSGGGVGGGGTEPSAGPSAQFQWRGAEGEVHCAYACMTHVGGNGENWKKVNQDAVFTTQPGADLVVWGVLDGHGPDNGALVAQTAASAMKHWFEAHVDQVNSSPQASMAEAFKVAHTSVREALVSKYDRLGKPLKVLLLLQLNTDRKVSYKRKLCACPSRSVRLHARASC